MTHVLVYIVLGLGGGALAAGLGLGLVVAYRGSGVVNLASGAAAGYTAYTFVTLLAFEGCTSSGRCGLSSRPAATRFRCGGGRWISGGVLSANAVRNSDYRLCRKRAGLDPHRSFARPASRRQLDGCIGHRRLV